MKFEHDLDSIYKKLITGIDEEDIYELMRLKEKLLDMYRRQLVKSNHSIMELIVATSFLKNGWKVDVEHRLNQLLVCDVYCEKDGIIAIVEVETGFVPPENALDPIAYRLARIASKAARYSPHADIFYFAVPSYHILQIPKVLILPLKDRSAYSEKLKELKKLCDEYYRNPPIELKELLMAKIDGILLLNVDNAVVRYISVRDYYSMFIHNLVKLDLVIDQQIIGDKRA